MKREFLQEVIIALLIILFVYAGASKLFDMKSFREGMMAQPFPKLLNRVSAMLLPFAEIVIAAGLAFIKTRVVALYAYNLLMLVFTVYTGLVVFDFFGQQPCGCGGIISQLNWTWHFIINITFLLLSLLATGLNSKTKIFMHKQEESRKPATE